jgi:Flp pilus assembly protein TadD
VELQKRPSDVLTIKHITEAASFRWSDAKWKMTPPVEHFQLGRNAAHAGQTEAAISKFRKAVELDPAFIEAHLALGEALSKLGRTRDALSAFQCAASLAPDSFEAQNYLGNTYYALGEIDSALATFSRCAKIAPENYQIQNNLGQLIYKKGDHSAAMRCFLRAIEIKPDYAIAHWNYAHLLLFEGNFEKGWDEFEWRLSIPALQLNRGFAQPQWDGSKAEGKSILLHCEGGHGDALQYVRFVPLLKNHGAKLILECQPALVSLFSASVKNAVIIPRGQPLPSFDLQIPLQSLPRIFETRLNTIPNSVPYLLIPPVRSASWGKRIPAKQKTIDVGLVWAGSETMFRSDSIDIFAPLADMPQVRFFSLQVGAKARQTPPPGLNLIDLTAHIHDFTDAAALIQQLDLVITVDTSVAHLAGGLAQPVWVVIPHYSDPRWLRDRSDSPWYPTMRLFRQTKVGDWQTPVQNMADALRSKFC